MTTRAWNRFQTSGSATQCHADGRQRATKSRQDRFLVVQARRHPFAKATTLRNELRTAVGVNISTQTVHNSLRQSGLRSRRACIRLPLPRLHKQARLNWTQDHLNWTDNDYDPEFFNDESRYCLDFTDRRARVWRRHGEQFQDANMSEHDPYVWSAVAQLVECRTRNRESPGSNPRCYRFEVRAFSFTLRRLSRLSCINEYLAIDSGGNVSE